MIRKSTDFDHPEPTDDEFVTSALFPLRTWEWFDGSQE